MFIISSIIPIVFGYKVETTKDDSQLDKMLDNLRFVCTEANGFSEERYEYYKEKLLRGYSSDNSNVGLVIESEQDESKIPVVSPPAPVVVGPKDTPWPMKCHDLHHTSQSQYSNADTTGLEKWRFHCDWVEGGPVIDSDGTIYFGDLDWWFYALYPDGTLKWKYETGGLIWSAPAIAEDGTIYIGSYDTKLYAINPNGTLKWKIGTGGSISSSPVIGEDGTIYFGTMSTGDSIVAMNPNGTIKWKYKTGDFVVSDPAIADDGTIYIGSADSYLYAMYPNGTLRWRFKTGDWIKSHPSIDDDGTIYFDSFDGHLYALYPNSTVKWKRGTGSGASSVAIGKDGTLYYGCTKLYAVYPNNGTTKWHFNLGSSYMGHASPAISADGTIYIGVSFNDNLGGEIIAVNSDGTERWRKKISQKWVESSPSIGEDGTVYIGSTSVGGGYLHAFGPVESNEPPGTPTISGETNGWAGKSYWYTFKSIDPDRNPISFYIDWGDGIKGWTSERASGENCYYDHAWSERDEYTIRCKTKDVMGEESDWGELTVTMPRNRATSNVLFYRFFEQFQILQKILCYIL